MNYSKLKRFAYSISFFVLLFSFFSCSKKDEAAPTAVDEIPATNTAETRMLLSANTWKALEFRPSPVSGVAQVDLTTKTHLYKFVDSSSTLFYSQPPIMSNYRAAYYTIDGNKITSRNTRSGDANWFLPTGPANIYILFKDSLMYINDRPTIAPNTTFNYDIADVPMMKFTKY